MCADHGERVSRLPFLANGKGDNSRGIASNVVLSAGDDR